MKWKWQMKWENLNNKNKTWKNKHNADYDLYEENDKIILKDLTPGYMKGLLSKEIHSSQIINVMQYQLKTQ